MWRQGDQFPPDEDFFDDYDDNIYQDVDQGRMPKEILARAFNRKEPKDREGILRKRHHNNKRVAQYTAKTVQDPLERMKHEWIQTLSRGQKCALCNNMVVEKIMGGDNVHTYSSIPFESFFTKTGLPLKTVVCTTQPGMYQYSGMTVAPQFRSLFDEFVSVRTKNLQVRDALRRNASRIKLMEHRRKDDMTRQLFDSIADIFARRIQQPPSVDRKDLEDIERLFAIKYAPRVGGSADKGTGVDGVGIGVAVAQRLGYGVAFDTSKGFSSARSQWVAYHELLALNRLYYQIPETYVGRQQLSRVNLMSAPASHVRIYGHRVYAKHVPEVWSTYQTCIRGQLNSEHGGSKTHNLPLHELMQQKLGGIHGPQSMTPDRTMALIELCSVIQSVKFPVNADVMAIVDTSGSMAGIPLHVAVGLGLIVAYGQDPSSAYYRYFMNFDASPALYRLPNVHTTGTGSDESLTRLSMAVSNMLYDIAWGTNTNFCASMDMMLSITEERLALCRTEEERQLYKQRMQILVVLTDMQFDQAHGGRQTPVEDALEKFRARGIQEPLIVLWNLRGTLDPLFLFVLCCP